MKSSFQNTSDTSTPESENGPWIDFVITLHKQSFFLDHLEHVSMVTLFGWLWLVSGADLL